MAKVVEGQLQMLQLMLSVFKHSQSSAVQFFKQYVEHQVKLQSMYPDVLPREITPKWLAERESGQIVRHKA